MTTYSLLIERIGDGMEGAHDLVNILADGDYQPGLASASLALEGHDGKPGCCHVFVPIGVMPSGDVTNAYATNLFCTDPDGTRHYDFATRNAALSFLRRLYGLDAPQRDPEPADEECWLCDGCGEVETFKADGTPITVGCPACVQRDRDAIIQRLRTENRQLRRALDIQIRPVSPRSVPSPLARDAVGLPHPIAQPTAERAAFFDATAYPHPPARNTQ
ncbi:hypothetical protein EQG41_08945 [Billgrantia azerbaijanica]|nr:hypothetical protein EQG41_08945 [Halomonas azerbaijanica]